MTDHYSFSKFNYFKVIGKTVIGVNFVDKLLFAIDLEKYNLLLNYKSNLEGLRKENQVFYSTMVKHLHKMHDLIQCFLLFPALP